MFPIALIRKATPLLILLAGLTGCGSIEDTKSLDLPEPPIQPTSKAQQRAATQEHKNMVDLLRKIRRETQATHPVLGDKILKDLREKLANLPTRPHPREVFELHRDLGRHELRMNHIEKGIKHLEYCLRLLEKISEKVRVKKEAIGEAAYNLAVGYLRLGETQNCCLRHTAESCIMPIQGGGIHKERLGSERAIDNFEKALTYFEPGTKAYTKSVWLLNLAHMTLDSYPDQVPTQYRIDPKAFSSKHPFPRFENIAPKLGLDAFDLAGGAIVEDFNGDFYLDVLVSSLDPQEDIRLFINDRQGGFQETTEAANLKGLLGGLNMVQTDFNNDGYPDVYVLRGGWFGKNGKIPNSLIRNNGDGTFTDITLTSGLGKDGLPSQTATWLDFDLDGDLDLVVGNENSPEITAGTQLFTNNGDETFTDITLGSGISNYHLTKGVNSGDINNDGYPDLYLSNFYAPNKLYLNKGDGSFEDISDKANIKDPFKSFPLWFWDYNNDGNLDIYVAAYDWDNGELDAVAAGYMGNEPGHDGSKLYMGDGTGTFQEVSQEVGLNAPTLPMGANFGDVNNDGFPDLYLGTGYPEYEALMPNVMYLNLKGERFADVTFAGGLGHLQKGHGVAFADMDNDGDQDIFEQIGGFLPGDKYGNALFLNPGGFGNHWLGLKLVGTKTNRAAVGVRIRILVKEGGKTRQITKRVSSGGNFGANPFRQTIGLGKAKKAEVLEIYWPVSQKTQRFENVVGDRYLYLEEGEEALREIPLKKLTLKPMGGQ